MPIEGAVERLAKQSGRAELDVAQAAIGVAGQSGMGDFSATAALSMRAAFLSVPGARFFEASIGYRPTLAERVYRLYRPTGWAGMVVPFRDPDGILVAAAALASCRLRNRDKPGSCCSPACSCCRRARRQSGCSTRWCPFSSIRHG